MTPQEWMAHQDRIGGCWREGYAAYEKGKCRRSPWPNLPEFTQAGLGGWDEARHEYEDAPPEE